MKMKEIEPRGGGMVQASHPRIRQYNYPVTYLHGQLIYLICQVRPESSISYYTLFIFIYFLQRFG